MPPVRVNRLREEVEHVAALQRATAGDRHDARDVARAARRLRAEADLAPDDEAAQRALGMVVGRLHARRLEERPQRAAQVQNVAAGARRLGMTACRALAQQRFDAMAQEQHLIAEQAAAQGPVPHPMPAGEHALRERDQFIADAAGGAAAPGDLGEVAQQVRPAQLPALRLDPGIGGIAVRHQDAGEGRTQRRARRLRAARGGRQEHRHAAGRHQPHPLARPTLLVPGFVGMHDGGGLHMRVRLGRDAGQGVADLDLALADGAGRQLDAEQVGQHTLRLPLGQVIDAAERADHGQQARTGHAMGNAGRQAPANRRYSVTSGTIGGRSMT